MPVINTRKRKPATTTASPLDRLLTVSALELNSPGPTLPTDDLSDASDSVSAYSGDVALGRIRKTARRGAKAPRRDAPGDDGNEPDAADSVALDISRLRALLHRVEHATGDMTMTTDGGCSTRLRDEILQLQATVNATLDRTRYAASSGSSSSTPLEAVQQMHTAVRRLETVLTEPVDAELLASHTRAPLELLWQQARQSVEHEMRAKLTFWKRKAHELRETLRASVQASDANDPSAAVLQDALDFVSTFYLLEMAPDQSRAADPFKGMAIAMATDTISHELRKLQGQRLRETTPTAAQPLANSLLLLSQRAIESPRPTPSTTVGNASGAVGETATWAAVPQAPPRMRVAHPPTKATAFRATTTASTNSSSRSATPAPAPAPPAPAPVPVSHWDRTNRDEAFPKIAAATGLSEATRRRLAILLDSQRQSKSPSSTRPQPPAVVATAPTASVVAQPTVVVQCPSDVASGPASQSPPTANGATPASSTSASVASTVAASPALPLEREGDGSDSDISHSGLGCATCGGNDSYSSLLLCDNGCEREFHTFCLQPPLEKIPEGDWYCPKCLAMEHIQRGSHVYSCSAPLCNKITGAKYCTSHRCKFAQCLNRGNLGGFCRRHESHRELKGARRSGSHTGSSSGLTTNCINTSPPTLAAVAPSASPMPTRPLALNAEQLVTNMRQMGIWLPENLMASTTTPKATVTATSETSAANAST